MPRAVSGSPTFCAALVTACRTPPLVGSPPSRKWSRIVCCSVSENRSWVLTRSMTSVGLLTRTPAARSTSPIRAVSHCSSRKEVTASRVFCLISRRLVCWVSALHCTAPSGSRPPMWGLRTRSLSRTSPLWQTWISSRGVMVHAPSPVSELLSTNPAKTRGLSMPRSPVNGLT